MIGKLCFQLMAVFTAVSATTSEAGLRGGNSNGGMQQLLDQILSKLETQEKVIESMEQRIASLQETIENLGPAMSRRQLQTGDASCSPAYNADSGYCVYSMPSRFEEKAVFENTTIFSDDATFLDDVRIQGPERDSAPATVFIVSNRVDMKLEQTSTLVVDTDSLFRDDMIVALNKDDVGDRRDRRLANNKYETQPKAYFIDVEVDGDELVEGDLEVKGDADFKRVDVSGNLVANTVTARTDLKGVTLNDVVIPSPPF